MRILNLILDGHPTFRPDVTALFGRYLPRLNIHTDLVTHAADGGELQREWLGGRVLLCRRSGSRVKDQIVAFGHDIRMLWRARAGDYDAVQVRDKVLAAVFAVWIARRRGFPLFYWMSFPMSEGYIDVARTGGLSLGLARWLFLMCKGYVGRALIYGYVLPRCAHVFVQSDQMLDDVAGHGIPRARMTPVPMGVDLERRIPRRSDALLFSGAQGRRVIAYLGSFERARHLEFLLEAMPSLLEQVPNAMLLMIGDGNEPGDRARLERSAAKCGIADSVKWTGWVTPDEAWRWVAGADVAVSIVPRGHLYDCASPTKVIEYMALGIPVVATDQPDQKKVIEESKAGVCVAMDRTAFVSAMTYILKNPTAADRMRAAGPSYISATRGYDGIAASVAAAYLTHVPAGG